MSSLNKRSITYPEASLTLAMSAAEGRLQLVLGREGMEPGGQPEILFAQDWQAVAQGVELLTPALDAALRALRLTPKHIGRVAAVSGPGSFTGLRLSIISAAGLARGCGALQAGLPYLSLLAENSVEIWKELGGLKEAGDPAAWPTVWVVTYARRGLVYAQGFRVDGEGMREISPLLVLSLEDAAIKLSEAPCVALGSGISRNREFFMEAFSVSASDNGLAPDQPKQGSAEKDIPLQNSSPDCSAKHGGTADAFIPDVDSCVHPQPPLVRLLGPSFDQPSPSTLMRAALRVEYSSADIQPLYARQSDAEENLEQISQKLGLEPQEARGRLEGLLAAPPGNQA